MDSLQKELAIECQKDDQASVATVQSLLDRGAKAVYEYDNCRLTFYTVSVSIAVFDLLLQNGLCPYLSHERQLSHVIIYYNNQKRAKQLLTILFRYHPLCIHDNDSKKQSLLHRAASSYHDSGIKLARFLVEQGADINAEDIHEDSARDLMSDKNKILFDEFIVAISLR